ncbi:MAG TPA: M15 family metallopeptidase [Clostridia bacterium]|nr:M15 family metallopeptidase [Clostridia bacterium]
MAIFFRSELLQTPEGYTLVLYIDRQTSEFAGEFLEGKRKELPDNTMDYVSSYINENYRDIKIKTVNIMLGSLLVASIAYSSLAAYAPQAVPSRQTGKPEQNAQAHNSGQESSPAEKAPVKEAPAPLLVNKTHSLPDGYVPSRLAAPAVSTVSSAKTKMTPEAAEALEALFEKAERDGIKLTAISGYRSYERQKAIFNSNTTRYGSAAAANQFSARPGQSEHQTGLAMDVSSASVDFALSQSFAETWEGRWLKENARYSGFIIRYPKGKEHITGYQFEPWHIRYVGKAAALEISARDITLEEYISKQAAD